MRGIILNDNDFKNLSRLKIKEIKKAENKFKQRKKNHLKDERLNIFYKLCTEDFNPMIYTIPLRCYFSFYLYVFLKNRAERFDFDRGKFQFLFSKPIDINFSEISRLANVPINTVKSAFKELVKHNFLIHSKLLSPSETNQSKAALLMNDYWLIGHNATGDETSFYTKSIKFTTN